MSIEPVMRAVNKKLTPEQMRRARLQKAKLLKLLPRCTFCIPMVYRRHLPAMEHELEIEVVNGLMKCPKCGFDQNIWIPCVTD
jgi:hypothetical protein